MLSLVGELDALGVEPVAEALAAIEAENPRLIVVDLAGLMFIDSAGLRLLAKAGARSRRNAWSLLIDNARPEFRRSIEVVGLDRIVRVGMRDDQEHASQPHTARQAP